MPTTFSSVRALLVVLGLLTLPALVLTPVLSLPTLAQDDDGGDDDDDDDGDNDSGSSSNDTDRDDEDDIIVSPSNPIARPRAQPRLQPVAPPVVLLEQAPNQIVVQTLGTEAKAQLLDQGFAVLSEGTDRVLLEVPPELEIAAALEQAALAAPTALVAPNTYYRTQSVPDDCMGALCQSWEAVGWPPVTVDPLCRFEPLIGVIDTGLNLEHDMLGGAKIRLERIGSAGTAPSEEKHGTAIVALFVGDADSRVPGLAPAADLLVIDPYGRDGNDERSDVFSLVEALDRLGAQDVTIASLSLAGPDNLLLADAVTRLQAQGIPLVAAVGNAGPRSQPLYPAAYPGVVAVTAVDDAAQIYRRAVQGDHVSFAGPGVAIPTAASIRGVRPQTGTSFAVPFVTTALAAAMADGTSAEDAIAALASGSRELGDAGKDPVFGWGLVQIPSPC
jgi:hypothetical protein